MADKSADPSNPSSDHEAMVPYWTMVAAIMRGVAGMRAGGPAYLPKFESEPDKAYERRLAQARMTNIFADVVVNLAIRPFEQPVRLAPEAPEDLVKFAEDLTGTGEDLTMFGAKVFRHALEDGITWILVDHSKGTADQLTVAEEAALGVRPFWVEYRAADVLAVYSERTNGVERFVEVRLRETEMELDGFEERTIERVRVFRHEGDSAPTWEIYEKDEDAGDDKPDWIRVEGPNEMSVDGIPIVPVVFGHRRGNGWLVDPPLRDAAYLQLELYQQENGLKNVRNFTAYPMLAGNGIAPPEGGDGKVSELVVGPRQVLYTGDSETGPARSWQYIEPAGTSLRFLRDDIKDTIRDLRELGRQPLSLETGNITVITSAALSQKNNSAIQAWAGFLGMSLERAFEWTAEWLDIVDPVVSVSVHADFDLGYGGDASFAHVLTMGTGPEPIISREAVLDEAKRRGVLGANYDPEEDLENLDQDPDDQDPEDDDPDDDDGGEPDDDE